jgi:hypothetical protein
MGVIGRLDDQVEEVIINPIGERNGQENTGAQTPPQPTAEPPQLEERAENPDDEEAVDTRASELPVWLL